MSADDADLNGIDDDELERGGVDNPDGAKPEHACPECGEAFESRAKLGLHRFRAHGIKGSSESSQRRRKATDRQPNRPKKAPGGVSRRAPLIAKGIRELADLADGVRGRFADDDLSIADTIRRDADKMGAALAGLADRISFLGPLADALFAPAGLIGVFMAFGPTLRKTMSAGGARRAERRELQLAELQDGYEQVLAEQGPDAAQAWAAERGLEIAGSHA